jgi:hypothetical protein
MNKNFHSTYSQSKEAPTSLVKTLFFAKMVHSVFLYFKFFFHLFKTFNFHFCCVLRGLVVFVVLLGLVAFVVGKVAEGAGVLAAAERVRVHDRG